MPENTLDVGRLNKGSRAMSQNCSDNQWAAEAVKAMLERVRNALAAEYLRRALELRQ